MKSEAEANADADQKARDMADAINKADSLIFQTEKQLKDYGDKIPDDMKAPIESALAELKEAHKNQDVDGINAATDKLNTAFQAASQHMYQGDPSQGAPQDAGESQAGADEEVTDVDFEEVKEDK